DEARNWDRRSTNGIAVVRRRERITLEPEGDGLQLYSGDMIELGREGALTTLEITLVDEGEAPVMSVRQLDDLGRSAAKFERDPNALSALYCAQKRVGAATDLDDVLIQVADCALELLPKA